MKDGGRLPCHALVEVLASQVGVSSGGLDLEHAALDGEDADVEGAASEVEDQDVGLSLALFAGPPSSIIHHTTTCF